MSDLGTLPDERTSHAQDIANDGLIIGFSRPQSGGDTATYWLDGSIHDLNARVSSSNSIHIRSANAVSLDGVIVASRIMNGKDVALVLHPFDPPSADITADCKVNIDDLLKVINEWGQQDSIADVDIDGVVGIGDLMGVIENWTVW